MTERAKKRSLFYYIKKTLKYYNNKFQEAISQQRKIQYGDVIGVSRLFYEHYGIYAGNDTVIHYSATKEDENIMIRKTNMKGFLHDSTTLFILDCEYKWPHKSLPIKYREVPDYIKKIKVYSPEETVKRAESRLGENQYSLLFNNCEHFAVWCKTGISKSYQLEEYLQLVPRIVYPI